MNCGGSIVVSGAAIVDVTVDALVGLTEVTLGVVEAADLAAEIDVHDVNATNTNATHAQDRRRTERPPITPPCCPTTRQSVIEVPIGHDSEGRLTGDLGQTVPHCLTGLRVTLRSIDEQESLVVKVGPYYTITPESGEPRHRDVYHDHDNCSDGQRILPKHKVRGKGGRPKCDECQSLG
jgi:hypothetical protein